MSASMSRRPDPSDSSSDSDSTDEEESKRLQEAAVTAEYFSLPQKKNKESNVTVPTSLGKNVTYGKFSSRIGVDDDDAANILGTTPEFRAHVAKRLADKLSREIEFCDPVELPTTSDTDELKKDIQVELRQDGVRLFKDSPVIYDVADDDNEDKPTQRQRRPLPRKRRRKRSTSSTSSSEEERLKAAAVTLDDLEKERQMLLRIRPSQPDTTPLSDRVMYVSVCGSSLSSDAHSSKNESSNASSSQAGSLRKSAHLSKNESSDANLNKAKSGKIKDCDGTVQSPQNGGNNSIKKSKKKSSCRPQEKDNSISNGTQEDSETDTPKKKKKKKEKRTEDCEESGLASVKKTKMKETENTETAPSQKKKKKRLSEDCEDISLASSKKKKMKERDDSETVPSKKKKKRPSNDSEGNSTASEKKINMGEDISEIPEEDSETSLQKKKKKKGKFSEDCEENSLASAKKKKTKKSL